MMMGHRHDRKEARTLVKDAVGLHELGLVDEESFRLIVRSALASEIEASFRDKLGRASERKREMVMLMEVVE